MPIEQPARAALAESLFAHGRPVRSAFDLLGSDENALTFALGYTFRQCPGYLQAFLREVGLGGLRRRTLAQAAIWLQRSDRTSGITDIEVVLDGRLHVIIEAKIGLGVPPGEFWGHHT